MRLVANQIVLASQRRENPVDGSRGKFHDVARLVHRLPARKKAIASMNMVAIRSTWLTALASRFSATGSLTKFFVLILALNGWRFLRGPAVHIQLHDVFDSEWPRYVEQARELIAHGPQAWVPLVAGGLPANASHFSQLHPLILIHVFLPPWLAFDFVMMLNGLVAGYGLFRLLSCNFGVDQNKAFLLGGIYSVFAQLNILPEVPFEYAFPLIVSLLHAPGRRVWLAASGVAALGAMSYPILNGAPFILGHFLLLIVMWTRGPVRIRRELAIASVFWIGYCIAFVPNLLALLDYLPYSIRDYASAKFTGLSGIFAEYTKTVASVAADQLLSFAIPGALVGTLCAARFDRTLTVAALLVAGVTLLCGFFDSPLYTLLHGTFFQKMDLYHVIRVLPQLYVILLGLALERTVLDRRRVTRYVAGATIGILFAAFSVPYEPTRHLAAVLMMTAVIGLVSWESSGLSAPTLRRREQVTVSLSIAILIFGVVYVEKFNRQKYNSFYDDKGAFAALRTEAQRDPFRVVVAGISASAPQMAGVETIDGHAAIFDRSFRDLLSLAATDRDPQHRRAFWTNWHDLDLTALIGYPFTAAALRLPVLAAMNVRYILSSKPIPGLEVLPMRQVAGSHLDKVYVQSVPDSMPRGYFAPNAKLAADKKDAWNILAALPDQQWSKAAVLTTADATPMELPKPQKGCGNAELGTYKPDRLIFRMTAEADCVFVIANNDNHNWRARIDGIGTKIFTANLAFQAVVVPRGAKELVLSFQPPLFPWILALLPLGTVIMFLSPYLKPRKYLA
jgi:hypothetical protein